MSYVRPSMGAEKVHRRVLHTIRCATDRWTVPGGYEMARCIAERESGPSTWPWAYNPSGSTGVFQIIPSTFASWWSAFGVRVKMAHLAHSVWEHAYQRVALCLGDEWLWARGMGRGMFPCLNPTGRWRRWSSR